MNRIRELRAEKGMKQSELAALLNCAPTAVSKWELEENGMDSRLIMRLCEIFDCRSDRKKEEPAGQPDELTLDVSDLTPENRQRVEDYLRLLLMSQQTPPPGGDSPGKADGTVR